MPMDEQGANQEKDIDQLLEEAEKSGLTQLDSNS
jgi:hypothetical protein